MVFKEYLNNPIEKSKELNLEGSNLGMSTEIMESKNFKILLARNSEYLKKLAKESEGEITMMNNTPLKRKNISCFNQFSFQNVKKICICDNDVSLTKEILTKLLIKV